VRGYFEPGLEGDVVEPLPLDGDDVDPVELDPGLEVVVLLPVRSEVDGDADGVPVPRSLVLPDGPWLHPVASAAMSEKAETPQSSLFMNTPPAEFGRDCGAASEVPPTPRWRP
jgi:hypothetical protein